MGDSQTLGQMAAASQIPRKSDARGGRLGCPHEQAAITGMVRDWKRSKFLPHPSINSYLYREYGENRPQTEGQWFKGDFLLHLPGLPLSRRLAIVARKLANDVITEDQTQL